MIRREECDDIIAFFMSLGRGTPRLPPGPYINVVSHAWVKQAKKEGLIAIGLAGSRLIRLNATTASLIDELNIFIAMRNGRP